jgi:phosphotransferase system HPr (HPr) family protein
MALGTAKISDPVGLHLRAASAIVKLAKRFPCDIRISYDGLQTNAKSILGLASLVARHGETLEIRAEGEQSEAALAALVELIEVGLSEDMKS